MKGTKPFRGATVNSGHPLARGMFDCWLLNEGSAGKVFDVVERKVGTLYGGVQWKAGRDGYCLELDGASGYVTLATHDERYNKDTGFSWSTLVKFRELPSVAGTSFWLHYKASGSHFWYGQTKAWNDKMGVAFVDALSTVHTVDGPVIEKGRWYHVTFVFNGRDINLYVDGAMTDTNDPGSTASGVGSSFRIGHTGAYGPEADFEFVMFWDRALSAREAALLYREPYAMFERPLRRQSFVHVVGLEGSIEGRSGLGGTVGLVCRDPWQGGSLDIERKWLRGALFGGMDSDAMKLGTALSGGWFWMRPSGCSALYRGSSVDEVDYEQALVVEAAGAETVSPPSYAPHNSGQGLCYAVRRFNGFGIADQTTAVAKVSIGEDGELELGRANVVLGLNARRVEGGKVRLSWFYDSLDQKGAAERFNIYSNGGTGEVDFADSTGTVSYCGRRFYEFISQGLGAGSYCFAVCVQGADGFESSAARVEVDVPDLTPAAAEILSVSTI